MKDPLRVFIVDDHDLVRSGIRHMLEADNALQVVGEAESGEKALEVLCSANRNLPLNANRKFETDILLLDVQMPGIGGIETARKLLRLRPDIKILVISVCKDTIFPTLLLKSGVHGYMTKGANQGEMLTAITKIAKGERYLSSEIAHEIALKHIDHGSKFMLDVLSGREKQIAIMIAEGSRAKEIGRKLYLSSKTVNSYRYRIFEKLHIKSDLELANFFEMCHQIAPNEVQKSCNEDQALSKIKLAVPAKQNNYHKRKKIANKSTRTSS